MDEVIIEDDYKIANVISNPTITNRKIIQGTKSAVHAMERKIYYADNFKAEETGLYHPSYASNVKLTNEGNVSIFTESNTGLDIDRKLQLISVYANTIKEHLHSSHRWLSGNDMEYIKGKKETHVAGLIYIDGENNLELKIKDDILASSTNLTINVSNDIKLNVSGNVNAIVDGHAKIEVGKDIDVRSKKNIDIYADGYVRVDGSRVFIGMEAFK